MASINHIRKTFLDYFEKNGHLKIPSSSLVPENDPTLMFTNSGMVQFKNIFTGDETRPAPSAVTAQKCIRAGGKHNDLENVGYTARHHTFFEMLGNFSFGDYFKEQAIELAWNLITQEFGISRDKLLVTIYHDDSEAENYWKKIANLSDDKIIKISTEDNFWRMGNTGPCGPCSEIFYDHGEDIAGGPPGSADENGDRFIEIWNLVFMQYEQVTKDKRVDLPKASIDTGMGIERIAAILQNKHNNYDTDIFADLIANAADIFNQKTGDYLDSYRVIADHLRSIGFLIAEGVLPSNEGRGYVLRRIMRRAMRHAHIIGAREPILFRLVSPLTKLMGAHYTELFQAEFLISETLKNEEVRFQDTLSRGLKLLEEEISSLKSGGELDGKIAFSLYDTYGFPIDLTADILRGHHLKLDMNGFDTAMEEQRVRARLAWKGSGTEKTDKLWFELKNKTQATEFLGYNHHHAEALIQYIIMDSKEATTLKSDEEAILITNQTPFYAESGGQAGDKGKIFIASKPEGDNTAEFIVTDTQKAFGLFLHYGKMQKGTVSLGDAVHLEIDMKRRTQLMRHHSATHLLQQALRTRLGNHIAQSGSLVESNYLRFDFSHPKAIHDDDLLEIETQINQQILNNTEVLTLLTDKDSAVKSGALALFGEKYDDEVRVVSIGNVQDNRKYSVELCGGTHVKHTAEIGMFKILRESAIAAGVRRIEAIAGEALMTHLQKSDAILKDSATLLKTKAENIPERIANLNQRIKQMENETKLLRQKASLKNNDKNFDKQIGDIKVIMRALDCPPKDLKILCNNLHNQEKMNTIIVLGTVFDESASLMVSVSPELTVHYNAADLINLAAGEIAGQGGGKATIAQAGGKNFDGLDSALQMIMKAIENINER